jgi:hypothetical protein
VNLIDGSAVTAILPENGPAAVNGVAPPPFTCECPSTSHPEVKISSAKSAVIKAIDDERKRDAFESTVAPSRIATVITEPTTTEMWP